MLSTNALEHTVMLQKQWLQPGLQRLLFLTAKIHTLGTIMNGADQNPVNLSKIFFQH